eukprot:5448826-Prymnesium_polylepis.1
MPWTEPGLLKTVGDSGLPRFSQITSRTRRQIRDYQGWLPALIKEGTGLRTASGQLLLPVDRTIDPQVAKQAVSVRPKISASGALQLVQRTLADLGASGT